ncbi:MAG TPA: hypothetical protein VFI20_11880 [Terracidiphilus sp.]|nr:hypothetical protein [Terracidiphilus sp.]
MEDIFRQVGALLLGSIPTALLFIVLVLAYQFLVQRPLTAVLRERRARTEGAVEDAHKAIAEAEARAEEYATRLRQARAEIFKSREQRIVQWTAEKDATLEAARLAARDKVQIARRDLEAEAARAQQAIHASVAELAEQVARAVLPIAAGGTR